jgi:hypothetical protein
MRTRNLMLCCVLAFVGFYFSPTLLGMLFQAPFADSVITMLFGGLLAFATGAIPFVFFWLAFGDGVTKLDTWAWNHFPALRAAKAAEQKRQAEEQSFDASLSPREREIFERGTKKGYAAGYSAGETDGFHRGSSWAPINHP